MPYKRVLLATTEIYHVFTKSIAGFKIFNSNKAFQRMEEAKKPIPMWIWNWWDYI